MFFAQLSKHGRRLAVVDGDRRLSYRQLSEAVAEFQKRLPEERSLVLLMTRNDLETLVAYLACLVAGHPLLLVDRGLDPQLLAALVTRYQPNLQVQGDEIIPLHDRQLPLAEGLALLLSTSGSTGSPKQVALSAENLDANARSILASLPIQACDRTITTLPFQYSYGLSVINSHLLAGACLVMNEEAVVSRRFWDRFRELDICSLAGVPFSYEMLLKLRFTQMDLPSLRYLTQAGGRLPEPVVRQLAEWAAETGRQFFVMYGQTEATARMAINVQPLAKPGAIGQAIPDGEFRLLSSGGSKVDAARQEGELIYRGPNVMLGYAESLADLAAFSPPSWLATGDLAWRDEDGDFYISGRLKRMIKPFGQRIGLDDVERLLAERGMAARAVGIEDALRVAFVPGASFSVESQLKEWLAKTLALHPSAIRVRAVPDLPARPNGKADYPAVERLFDE